jgi:hypothetical protein
MAIELDATYILKLGDNIKVKNAGIESCNGKTKLEADLSIYTFGGWESRRSTFLLPQGVLLFRGGLSLGFDSSHNAFYLGGKTSDGSIFKVLEDAAKIVSNV